MNSDRLHVLTCITLLLFVFKPVLSLLSQSQPVSHVRPDCVEALATAALQHPFHLRCLRLRPKMSELQIEGAIPNLRIRDPEADPGSEPCAQQQLEFEI